MFQILIGGAIGLGMWWLSGKAAGAALYASKRRKDQFAQFWNAPVDYETGQFIDNEPEYYVEFDPAFAANEPKDVMDDEAWEQSMGGFDSHGRS